ncbi:hypothetical protein ACWDRB_60885 [Nonomuraea sp. NPDC003707]
MAGETFGLHRPRRCLPARGEAFLERISPDAPHWLPPPSPG